VARPNLRTDWTRFQHESGRLQSLVASLGPLSPAHQKLVAEIAMIRLVFLVSNTIASIGAKLVCDTRYLDGSVPNRQVLARSVAGALLLMKTHGRVRPLRDLSWTSSKAIRRNVRHALLATHPFVRTVSAYAAHLTEMRYVRNHVAHSSTSTRADFRKVIRNHYGGLKQGMTPGLFLLTGTLGSPCRIETYIASSRVTLKQMTRA
jgi:hypothetical protein